MRFALVPLDDRPCHTRFPRRLSEVADVEVALPPRELLGRFLTPGQPDAVLDWLEAEAPGCDGVAICGEMAICGGLVAARTPDTSLEQARRRVIRVKALVDALKCPVALGCGITRATITVASDTDRVVYERIARYSELRDLADSGDSAAAAELREIVKLIPDGVLKPFLAARERNHGVNRAFVELGALPSVKVVVLAQEDCKPHGLHRREQRALAELRHKLGLDAKVLIHPGADEASVVLLARVILEAHRVRPRIRAEIVPAAGASRIAPYEDRPVVETVSGKLAAAGVDVAAAGDPSAPLLVVAPPLDEDERDPGDHYGARLEHPPRWIAEVVSRLRGANHALGLADTCVDNGAYMPLLRAVRDAGLLDRLAVYSAWNTAGNTLGTAVSFMAVATGLGRPDADALRRFRPERLMDDGAYQALVRGTLQRRLESDGASIYRLEPAQAADAERWLGNELPATAEREGLVPPGARWDIALPWGRTFECDVALRG